MSRQFIGIWGEGDELRVEVGPTLTSVLLRPGGRVGALIPARPSAASAFLPETGAIVFLVSRSPSELLASLANDFDDEVRDSTFLTHGHASAVLILREGLEWRQVVDVVQHLVAGYEVWPIAGGTVSAGLITTVLPEREDLPPLKDISCEGLGFESAAQIRQFNANLALLTRCVSGYAPEVWPLIQSLHSQVAQIADRLRDPVDSGLPHATRVSSETVLIETNAVVTLYCSQLGSGTLPLHKSTFPVGEYSLLGIGGMCRAAWRLYEHLNSTFAAFDHPTLIRDMYPTLPDFDPFGPSSARQDFSSWRRANFALHDLPPVAKTDGPRFHVPYFSSRWGFHESLHAISLSWQCLYASATREWNLLTLTHEFLHSQVRAIFAQIMSPRDGEPDLAEQIAGRFNARSGGSNARESMQVAIAEALNVCRSADALARAVTTAAPEGSYSPIAEQLSAPLLHDLVRDQSGILHEIAVHVLDFRYVYAGRDEEYVQSIWSSWSLVPGVADQVEHYVLRTLCALSSVTELDDDASNKARFEDAIRRLRVILEGLCSSEHARPALTGALAVLDDEEARLRLSVQFNCLRYIVELAQTFLFDERLNTALTADSQTDEDVESGRFTYDLVPGQYVGRRVESPIAFLLDRFAHYSDRAGSEDAEFESIWQMLQLI